jgi:uncharacterized membrane protein YadS
VLVVAVGCGCCGGAHVSAVDKSLRLSGLEIFKVVDGEKAISF